MTVIVIHKTLFTTGEYRGVKNIAFNSATQVYTLTLADDSTTTFNAGNFYLQFIWG